jgi:hypothetical protein
MAKRKASAKPRKIGVSEAFNPLYQPKTTPKTKGYKTISQIAKINKAKGLPTKTVVDPKTGRRKPVK